METTPRKTYLDALRILACLGVIYNHVMGHAITESATAVPYWVVFDYFLCKTAVPIFFMITGTLLLSRVDTYAKTFLRIVRIGLALALFIGLNYAVSCLQTGERFDVGTLILSIYRDRLGITYSYWYLYRYLSLLVMLPLLQRMMTRLTPRDMRYFLLLSVGLCGMMLAASFYAPWLRANQWLTIPLFSTYIGMLVQGYYVDRTLVPRRGYGWLAALGLLAFNAVAALLLFDMWKIDPERAWYLDRCDRTSVVLAAGCIFYLVKRLDERISLSARVRGAISSVGRLTFCVYLVSELLIDNLVFVRTWLGARMPLVLSERLYVLAVFGVGLLIAAVLTRVPLLKKLL